MIVVLQYMPVNPASPTRVIASVFSSNNVRITLKGIGMDEEYEFLQYEDKGFSGYFQTDRIFKECCMMCRMEKSKQSYVTSWIVLAEKQQI